MAICELLVAAKVVKEIYLTRLPVGHTHEVCLPYMNIKALVGGVNRQIFVGHVEVALNTFYFISPAQDIDSKFGKIWVALRCEEIGSPQDYAAKLEKVFASSKIKCEVKDVFATPDYVSWLRPIIDPQLKRWTKELYTQLQWSFVAIDRNEHFPTGVKVM